jgi:hypothetical protein
MLYGAALSVVAAVALVVFVGRERSARTLITVAFAAFLMPLIWNVILRRTGATSAFSHDLPFKPFPVSWQDTGSGVFTLSGVSLALILTVLAKKPAARAGRIALLAAAGAFLIDIYAY